MPSPQQVSSQSSGHLIGQRLDLVDHRVDGYSLWDRAPHAVTFTSPLTVWRKDAAGEWVQVAENKTFTVVPLHMKSNYGGGTLNMLKRELEAKTLVAVLEQAKAEDKLDSTLVLIGDNNVLKYDEPAIVAMFGAGYIDLNNTDSPTYWSRSYGGSPFDRAFIAPDRPEFRYSRQYVLLSADLVLHDQFLSDHYMIKMSVKLYLDESDSRDVVHQ